jgi:tRNA-specific 2-thiouridylase
VLLAKARRLGAKRLATGHYVRVDADINGRYRLRRGIDPGKDQSYFLSRLTQYQLAQACFPLGTWTKSQVRTFAFENGLRPVTQKESQDICFIHDNSYAAFLNRSTGVRPQPGDIVDTTGNLVGAHNGLHRYTIGQRRGINCPAKEAYYVVWIDVQHNRLIVGRKDELLAENCRVREINWIGDIPQSAFAADVRIRYRHDAASAMVYPRGQNRATIAFDQPQSAVTPGQGAVFYRGDEVLGGGWIEN